MEHTEQNYTTTPHSMTAFIDQDVAINLKLLKQCHFYQMFDTSNRKVFGWNVHQICFITFAVVVQCFVCYGNAGSVFEKDDVVTNIDYFLIFHTNILTYLSLWKFIVYLYNANRILDVFNVTRINFLMSESCCNYSEILYKYRNKIIRFTNWYIIFSIVIIIQWLIFPLAINMFIISDNSNVRYKNIMNLRYDVSTHTYNQYIIIFFLMETTALSFAMYFMVMTDLLLISLCSAIITQQEVLINAFKNIGHEDKSQIEYYEQLKSILDDQLRLDLKTQSFYSAMKSIVLVAVAINSTFIIILTYLFILVCLTAESDTSEITLILIKLGSSAFYISLELFLYCYLFENINIQRELVSLSLYSCDWTKMNLKFKKLLLLSMHMNNASEMLIKASPKKIINLQLFANIISMSYNVVSVMLKTTSSKSSS